MTGRTIIVTGANSGIGFEIARYLCEGGNDTILACRDETKTNAAIERIKKSNPTALATFMMLDLADFDSIQKFVEDFRASGKKLYGLINNAGILMNQKDAERQFNKNNIELTMATNYFGPFLLTNLLIDDLKAGATDSGSRIVNVGSKLHDSKHARKSFNVKALDLEDVLMAKENAYSAMNAYKNSKACLLMMTFELSKRLEGSGVTVNCVCPGFVPSSDLSKHQTTVIRMLHKYVLSPVLRISKHARSISQGAASVYNLVLDDQYKDVTGKYFSNNAEAEPSAESLEKENWEKLWTLAGGYTKMEGFEPIEAPIPPTPEEKAETKPEKEENNVEKAEEEQKELEPEDKKEPAPEIIETKPQEA